MSVKATSQVSILDITDAYSITLTSEAFAFVGNTSGAPSGLSCATQVVAYCGTQQCQKVTVGTITCPSGISASISNNGSNAPIITFTTTATITAACEATIPVTVDGVTINKKFSFAVAKTGATGNGVKSTTVTYQASSSGTTIPTGMWQSSVPSVSAGQYLWTKTYTTYTSGTNPTTSYSVGRMGTNGTNGTNGSNGRGISSTVVTYQAGSSGTSAPTGTWTSSVPATTAAAPYLWSKTVVTYTDNTTPSTTYSVGSTPEGIVVGGRNLIRNTATMPGVFGADTSGASTMGTAAYQSDGSALVTNSNSNFRFVGPEFNVAAGEVYTISAYYKEVSGTQTYQFQITYTAGISGGISGVGTKQNIGDGWIKSYYTFIIPTGCTKIRIWLRSGEDWKLYTHSYYVKHPKLELGNKATDWTPAPEDTEAEISALSIRVTNAETSIIKNNEAIQLRATKTEVATAVNNIQVGGRNLIIGSSTATVNSKWFNNGWFGGFSNLDSSNRIYKLYNQSGWHVARYILDSSYAGKTVTLSFKAKIVANETTATYYPLRYSNEPGANPYISGKFEYGPPDNPDPDTWYDTSATFVLNRDAQVGIGAACDPEGQGLISTWLIKDLKLELGNKATDWTPAPEDLETRVTTAESKIDQTANKISLVVRSGDSESNMVLTDKVCQLVANNINLNGRVTISGLDSTTQTKINNGNTAKSTLDNKSGTWDNAYTWSTSGDGSKLLSMVKKWTGGAVSDTTTINGGWIATNTITANKIAIGDFTNYCTVNANVPETMLPTSFFIGGTKVNGGTDTGGLAFGKASNSQQYLAFCDYTPFLFKPGEQLYFYGNIPNWSSTDCSAGIYMWLYDSNKNYLSNYAFWQGTLTKTTWNKISGNITITNTNMQQVKYFIIGIDTGTTGHMIGGADLICKKKTTGELIVDGSITADKIAAGAITADKLAAGSITADKIAAGSITADKLSSSGLTLNTTDNNIAMLTVNNKSGSAYTTISPAGMNCYGKNGQARITMFGPLGVMSFYCDEINMGADYTTTISWNGVSVHKDDGSTDLARIDKDGIFCDGSPVCVATGHDKFKIIAGSTVVNGNSGATSANIISNSTLNSRFGVSNCSNTNVTVLVANGDGNACSLHFNGTTYQNGWWFAVFDGALPKAQSIRINWIAVYFT